MTTTERITIYAAVAAACGFAATVFSVWRPELALDDLPAVIIITVLAAFIGGCRDG